MNLEKIQIYGCQDIHNMQAIKEPKPHSWIIASWFVGDTYKKARVIMCQHCLRLIDFADVSNYNCLPPRSLVSGIIADDLDAKSLTDNA